MRTILKTLWEFLRYWHAQMWSGDTDDWRTWAAPWVIAGFNVTLCWAYCVVVIIGVTVWVGVRDYVLPHL